MASVTGGVWALDIGNNSLKALCLGYEAGVVKVLGFDNIQHSKILVGSGISAAEKDELVALSLSQFLRDNNPRKSDIIISVPSQNSFARFVKLPPVEPKRVPEIVRFEAAQQIPFDMNEVVWDWQLMSNLDSPEIEVGLFAIKETIVTSAMEHFSRENLVINTVQMAPMALYNYVLYDRGELFTSENQAVVILNVGAETTDVVVCTKSAVWQRCVTMGGNAFTRAVAEAFKLNFEKAEKLKRTAPMSKYKRQIYQAMRPVFIDFVSDIQRSLGFYSSSNPNVKLSKMIAMGGGAKLSGLIKYLQQKLQMPIEMPDAFKKLMISQDVSMAKFHDNVGDFGVVYGLALQALGVGKIGCNLLPRNVARSMMWYRKTKYFVTAACILLFVAVLSFAKTNINKIDYKKGEQYRQKIKNIADMSQMAEKKLKAEQSKTPGFEQVIEKQFEIFKYRDVIPQLYQTILSVLPNGKTNPEQKDLYRAFDSGDVRGVMSIPRKQRKQIFITTMTSYFSEDIANASFGGTDFISGEKDSKDDGKTMEDLRSLEGIFGGATQPKFKPTYKKKTKDNSAVEVDKSIDGGPGFVVSIAGYSPYENIGELMDPAGVENDKEKWGFVTRFLHLDEIVDGNSPFELFGRTNINHFKLEIGEIDLTSEMPIGIGISDEQVIAGGTGSRRVLIDPMTREVISRIADLNQSGEEKIDWAGNVSYQVNDHWFVLNIKLAWENAPQIGQAEGNENDQ